MSKQALFELAESLRQAEKNRKAVAPLTERHPSLSIEDAYSIQMLNVDARLKAGGKIIGKKVGLTSKAMQDSLGVNEPDFGHLFADMVQAEEVPLSISAYLQPKIEAELAFILGEDLKGPGVSIADVLRASAGVMASFEVIDSRVADWKIKIQDTIADNGSSAGLLLGAELFPVSACNLKYVGLVLEKNGKIIDTAAGGAVLGHPAASVAWLANSLGSMGTTLRKGEIILSGSFTKAYPVAPGDNFSAHFGGLGSVKISFTE